MDFWSFINLRTIRCPSSNSPRGSFCNPWSCEVFSYLKQPTTNNHLVISSDILVIWCRLLFFISPSFCDFVIFGQSNNRPRPSSTSIPTTAQNPINPIPLGKNDWKMSVMRLVFMVIPVLYDLIPCMGSMSAYTTVINQCHDFETAEMRQLDNIIWFWLVN